MARFPLEEPAWVTQTPPCRGSPDAEYTWTGVSPPQVTSLPLKAGVSISATTMCESVRRELKKEVAVGLQDIGVLLDLLIFQVNVEIQIFLMFLKNFLIFFF